MSYSLAYSSRIMYIGQEVHIHVRLDLQVYSANFLCHIRVAHTSTVAVMVVTVVICAKHGLGL